MYYERYIEARSRNQLYLGRATTIAYSEYVFVV
jgi:hypothetical protein